MRDCDLSVTFLFLIFNAADVVVSALRKVWVALKSEVNIWSYSSYYISIFINMAGLFIPFCITLDNNMAVVCHSHH